MKNKIIKYIPFIIFILGTIIATVISINDISQLIIYETVPYTTKNLFLIPIKYTVSLIIITLITVIVYKLLKNNNKHKK